MIVILQRTGASIVDGKKGETFDETSSCTLKTRNRQQFIIINLPFWYNAFGVYIFWLTIYRYFFFLAYDNKHSITIVIYFEFYALRVF